MIPTLLGLLKRVSLDHWNTKYIHSTYIVNVKCHHKGVKTANTSYERHHKIIKVPINHCKYLKMRGTSSQ